jgi:hypothetical protein
VRFVAEQPLASALDQAPEFRREIVDPEVRARAFNDTLFALLEEIVEADPERLLDAYPVPAAVVGASADSVDLTDDGTGPEAREWLHVEYIDYGDMVGPIEEVTLLAIEARHAAPEYEGGVVGMLVNQYDTLQKLAGWEAVDSLTVWGVLAPPEVTRSTLGTLELRYPRVVRDALVWGLVLWMASHVGIKDARLQRWDQLNALARERLGLAATRPVSGRIEFVQPSGR